MIIDVVQNLYKDDEVRKVLGIILCIGNKLNTGNQRRGNARGFKLDILGKLKDVKSDDGSTNLLEYVVKSYTASRTKKVDGYSISDPQDYRYICMTVVHVPVPGYK